MFDAILRPVIDPPLDNIARRLTSFAIRANTVTLVGFFIGLLAIISIASTYYHLGLIFILLNRFCDGLDGAVARIQGLTDFGSVLDIVCDFLFYAGVVFAFAVAEPHNALAACFLLFSFIGPMVSFLCYAIVASKRQLNTNQRGQKSWYHSAGLCEGTETIAVFVLCCLFPQYFVIIALIYAGLCWLTTLSRVLLSARDFSE